MRILHTIASLRPEVGGPARSVPGLARALGRKGVDVHLWAPEGTEEIGNSAGFTVHRGPLEEVLGCLGGVELVHDHGLWLPFNHRVAQACRQHRIPRMVSPRGMLEPWALNHKRWKKKAAWWLYQRKDLRETVALHATADSEAGQFRLLGLKSPIHIIPNGVDPDAFASADAPVPSTGPCTALFLGRIHPKKGLPLLVDAWAKARPSGWRMKVVGPDEGGHRAQVQKLVEKAGLIGEWEFSGPLDGEEKRQALAAASLFILPTYSENFGIAVAEALSSGLPVITTTGTPWQKIREHQCGWWVDPDANSLRTALAEATTMSPEQRKQMGRRGAAWMAAEYGWDGIADRMLAAYESLKTHP